MNKAFSIWILIFGPLLLMYIPTSVMSEPKVIRVPTDYDSIQSAINDASSGDTILVSAGVYYECLLVNKTLQLVGEDRDKTIIDGNGTRKHIVTITADDVIFEQFTVRNGTDFLIFLDHTFNVTVANNIIEGNTESQGVWLEYSNSNRLIDNLITGHGFPDPHLPYGGGLYIKSSKSNIIQGNNITDNIGYSIALPSSPNNTITQNIISSDYSGIDIVSSNGCVIYHNILDNPIYYIDSPTKWNNSYPSGGNYWSEYHGRDLYSGSFQNETGCDGIGDTPLDIKEMFPQSHIDPGNIDHYPLMGTFSSFKATPEHQVQTISNSTVSNFSFNGTAISFNITGEDGTTCFCRILIPTALINKTYTVFVNGNEVSHDLLPFSNSTHSYLYFTYNHSTQEVTIIPEFPSILILPSFLIATLLIVTSHKRKIARSMRISERREY